MVGGSFAGMFVFVLVSFFCLGIFLGLGLREGLSWERRGRLGLDRWVVLGFVFA